MNALLTGVLNHCIALNERIKTRRPEDETQAQGTGSEANRRPKGETEAQGTGSAATRRPKGEAGA